ncbi:MAG: hypothetical protein GY863_02525 [bacterium]|nr:hypothetical protein [bacterium]
MDEIKIGYKKSPDKERRKDRMQLIAAGAGLMLSIMDSLETIAGIQKIIAGIIVIAAVINIIIAVKYDKVKDLFKNKLEPVLYRVNGFTFIIIGLNYQYMGSNYIQYSYYAIAIVFLIFLPRNIARYKSKQVLTLDNTGLNDKRTLLVRRKHLWSDIEIVDLKDSILEIKLKNKNKPAQYYLIITDDNTLKDLAQLLSARNEDAEFKLKISENIKMLILPDNTEETSEKTQEDI